MFKFESITERSTIFTSNSRLHQFCCIFTYMNKHIKVTYILNFILVVYSNLIASQNYLLDSALIYFQSDEVKSKIYEDSCIRISTKFNDHKSLGEIYKQIGIQLYLKGSYEKAYKYYTNSIASYEKANDSIGIASTYLELANFYKKKNQLAESKQCIEKALQIGITTKNGIIIANSYNNLGLYFETIYKLDTAIRYYSMALEKYKDISNDNGVSYSLEYIAGIYKTEKKYKLALNYLLESLSYRKKTGNKNAIAISIVNIGELYAVQSNNNEALRYFNQCIELCKEIKYNDLLAYTYFYTSKIYKAKQDYKNAYNYQDSAMIIQELLNEELNSKQLKEIQTKYETENKEKLLKIKDLKIAKQDLKLANNKTIIYTLILLFLGSAFVFYIAYSRYKTKQKNKFHQQLIIEQETKAKAVLEAEENERQRIGKELHDGIGQMLSAVKLNIEGLENNITHNPNTFMHYTNTTKQLLDESVKEVRTISHNLMPTTLLNKGLPEAIENMVDKLKTNSRFEIEYICSGFENKRLNKTIEIVLYRVIQELVQNCIKHSNANKISIQLLWFEKELTIMVEDNGKGFDVKKIIASNNGIGITNIQSRINYINASIHFDSTPGKGSSVIIEKNIQETDYEQN